MRWGQRPSHLPTCPPDGASCGLEVLPAVRQLQGLSCCSAGPGEGGRGESISSALFSREHAGGLSGCFAASLMCQDHPFGTGSKEVSDTVIRREESAVLLFLLLLPHESSLGVRGGWRE